MKILWLIPLTVDAAFQFTSKNELARAVRKLGHEIETVVAYRENRTSLDGFSVVEYIHTPPSSLIRKFVFHWKMLLTVWKTDADIIMFGFQAAHLILLARLGWIGRSRPKFILDIRTVPVDVSAGFVGRIELWRYKLGIKLADIFCDGITVITPMLGETVKPALVRLKNRIGVWSSGVNLQQFEQQGPNMKKQLKLEDKRVLLYHGVLSPNRGLQNAIRAVSLLRDELPELEFLFVGDGYGREELELLGKELHLDDRIKFTGKVPYKDIPQYIRTADLAILPFPNIAWWEVSSPIKLMEYLAMGIPVVATDIAAHRFVIDKVGGAVLSENYEPANLADAIRKALSSGVKSVSCDILENTISWDKQAKSLAEFVEQIES